MEFIACFILIVILIRVKTPVGITLVIASLALTLMEYGFSVRVIDPFWETLRGWRTWKMIITVTLVIILGDVLSRQGYLERMVNSLKSYISPNWVARIAPALIGLLPMPGGAMVSAPIVEELAKDSKSTPEAKTVTNYWWRHVWEPVWPLYQSVILAAAMFNVSVWQIAGICYPISLVCILAGTLTLKLPLPGRLGVNNGFWLFVKELVYSMWPVFFIVVSGIIFNLDLIISLLLLFVVLLVLKITNFKMIVSSFRKEFSFDILMIFIGGLSMMNIIEMGQAGPRTLAALQAWGVPIDLVVFVLPFLVGLITGLTPAFVGVGFPLVASAFALTGHVNSGIYLAYAGGLVGILTSPVHLCLVLTKKYFKAGFKGIYKHLVMPLLITVILVFVIKYIFFPN